MAYIGNTTKSSPFITDSYTGTGSQTAFLNMTYAPASYSSIAVHVDGVYKTPGTDYTTSGKTLTFATAPSNGAKIIVLHLSVGQTTTTVVADGAITLAKMGTASVSNTQLDIGGSGSGKGAMYLPSGNTAQRPATSKEGYARFNSEIGSFEFYDGSAWIVTNQVPYINSVTGTIYSGNTSTITLNISDASDNVTVRFSEAGSIVKDVTGVSVVSQTAVVTIPSEVYGQTTGDTIRVSVINQSGTESSNYQDMTVRGMPTGGTITTNSGYRIHAFTSSGNFVVPTGVTISADFVVVGGGGGGGGGHGGRNNDAWSGGGGAGGVNFQTGVSLTAATYSLVVGPGGSIGSNGTDSTGFGYTGVGGGRGGDDGSSSYYNGANGGSGGGGVGDWSPPSSGGSGTSGQGYAGGPGTDPGGAPYYEQGGGGGGAGEVGNTDDIGFGGDGRDLSAYFTTSYGESGYFGGGGGGGSGTDNSGSTNPGGTGGGGAGGCGYLTGSPSGTAGTSNTGGGGGGGRYPAAGGSGIVIVRYRLT